MEFRILGPLEVLDGETQVPLGTVKQRVMLGVLLLHANEVVSRERLIDELWGEAPPPTARKAVNVYVSQLRKALGGDGHEPIATVGGGYRLSVDAAELDAARFRELVSVAAERASGGEIEAAADLYRQALALWRGRALAGLELASVGRHETGRWEELRVTALVDRIDCDLALGRHEKVIGELNQLVAEHPFRERVRAQQMLALYRDDRQADALAAYQQARQALVEELGIEPSVALQRLQHGILVHDPALVIPSGIGDRLPTAHSRLPVPLTSLIGRERDVRLVAGLLRDNRLVTLTGPGGSGKTRLAIASAHDAADSFPDGAWFVDLAPVRDHHLVWSAAAAALSIPEQQRSALDVVSTYLRTKRALLVLDNFEHVAAAAPDLRLLLERCRELRALVTSRVSLRVRGECEYDVQPLPADGAAVELFVERAVAVRGEAARTTLDSPVIAEICRRLDGLPLAIELAAARTRLFEPGPLLARLDRSLPILTSLAPDVPDRQRTLRDAIAWSHDLLDDRERRAFRRLSVFSGGCSLDAAEAVAEVDLETLDALAAANLLRMRAGADGQPRLRLLETIREYADEQLDGAAETFEIRRRHAEYFATWAEELEPKLASGPREPWLARTAEEMPNLRAALRWADECDAPELGLRLVGGMWMYVFRAAPAEGARWAALFLDRPGAERVTAARAWALLTAAAAAWGQGDIAGVAPHAQESVELARRIGDPTLLARALTWRGLVSIDDPDAGRAQLEEAKELSRRSGDAWGVAFATVFGAAMLTWARDFERAQQWSEETTLLCPPLGERWMLGGPYMLMAFASMAAGDLETARSRLEQGLGIMQETGDRMNAAVMAMSLGSVYRRLGDADRAVELLGDSLRASAELGHLGNAAACMDGLAALAAGRDLYELAAQLLGGANRLRAGGVEALPMSDALNADVGDEVRRGLGGDYERATAQDQLSTIEEAVDRALAAADMLAGDRDPSPAAATGQVQPGSSR